MLTRPLTRGLTRPLFFGGGGEPPLDPDALDWFERVEARPGGSFDLTSGGQTYTEPYVKSSWNRFFTALKPDGTWDQIDVIAALCGVTYAGLVELAKYPTNSQQTLLNFTSGQYNPTGTSLGLKGNGTSSSINTNWAPSDTLTSPNFHTSFFTTESPVGNDFRFRGAYNGNGQQISTYNPLNDGVTVQSAAYSTSFMLNAVIPVSGLIATNSDSTDHKIYQNGAQVASAGAPASGTVPTAKFFLFSGDGFYHTNARESISTMGKNLSPSQVVTLNDAVQRLMEDLGYIS